MDRISSEINLSTDYLHEAWVDCLNYYETEILNLIPLILGDKKPVSEWKEYQLRKITKEEIKHFFPQGTQHNIGVVCGAVSDNLYVLDFDTEEIFHRFFTKTDGLTVVKTGRGYHVYFKAESPVKTLKMLDSKGREIATLKGEGSYVVGPPSLHPSGSRYEFIRRGEIPRLTGDVRQQVKERAIVLGLTVPKDKIDLETLLKGVPAGNRDNSLTYLIHYLIRADISRENALKICEAWNERNKPPLGDVRGKVEYHYGLSEPYSYFFSLDPGMWNVTDTLTLERKKKSKTPKEEKNTSLIDRIIQLAFDNSEFIHDQYKDGFAVVNSGMNKKVIKLHSREFKLWMGKLFWDKEEKGITGDVLTSALNTIEGKALFEGERVDLHNRVASHNGKIYYEMSDEEGRIIEIDNNGWRFTTNSPVLFRREQHQKAQVEPKKGGNLDKLWTYLNLSSDGDSGDKVLFRSMLICMFFPDIDHAIPVLHGQQGSGKTFTSECIKDIVDPSSLKTQALSKDEQSLILTLYHNWLTVFDNVSEVKDWQSDILSRAITGEGVSRRRLYTDDEEQMYNFRRNVFVNGLIIPLTAPDVMDRSLLFKIERFEQHGSKEKLEKEFEKDKPGILGALFDLVSKTLKIKAEQKIETPSGIRLYDFGVIGEAAARAAGEEDGRFFELFLKKKGEDNFEVIQSSLMGSVLFSLISDGYYKPNGDEGDEKKNFLDDEEKWSGSPSELLEIFNFKAAELKIDKRAKEWKGSPKGLSNTLEKLKTNFKAIGVEIARGREHEGRFINILANETYPLHTWKKSSQPTQSSRPDEVGDECDERDEKIPIFKGYESDEKINPKDDPEFQQRQAKEAADRMKAEC